MSKRTRFRFHRRRRDRELPRARRGGRARRRGSSASRAARARARKNSRRNTASASRPTTWISCSRSPASMRSASRRLRRCTSIPALAAIRAGKHLMIEKPLDATVDGTDHILHAAQEAGVRVGSIFQARFGDAARAVKAAVEARPLRPHGARELLREVEPHHRVLHRLERKNLRRRRRRGHQPGDPRRRPAAVVRRHAGRSVRLDHAARTCHRVRRHLGGGAQVRQRRIRHHRSEHGAVARLLAPHRALRRKRVGGDGRRRHHALGLPRRASPKTTPSARRARRARKVPARPIPWPSISKDTCGRSRISSTASASSGRFSSKAPRLARPSRWCAPSTIQRHPVNQ